MIKARCPICDNEDPKKWENVDRFRLDTDQEHTEKVDGKKVKKPVNMCMCLGCGFVTYPDKIKSEEELKKYYISDYRNNKPPMFANLTTGQRKLYYHEVFLGDLFDKWKKDGKDAPVISEVGASMGMALNLFKKVFPKATIKGSEWTLKYRRVAYYEYGIELDEEFDSSLKYDLIMSYKVAEHQVDPDKKLREYAECLSKDGRLYISVPTWYNELVNSGMSNYDLPFYYHPAHINVWSRHTFEELLKKCGLEIVKENHKTYGDTYLCKRNDSLMEKKLELETPDQIKKAMDHIKQATLLYMDKKPEEALALWANCPMFWGAYYEANREKLHKENFDELYEEICEPFLEKNQRRSGSLIFSADLCMRYERYQQAAELLNELLDILPNNGKGMMMLSHCMRNMAHIETDMDRRLKMLKNSHSIVSHLTKVDMQSVQESVNWKYRDASELPLPSELNKVTSIETNQPQEK